MMRLASAFDGQFYPGDEGELAEWVDEFLLEAPQVHGELLGVLVPHAGYVYSGRAAGRAIGILRQDPPEVVVVLGPSHQVYFEGIRVFDLDGYETPLGPIAGAPALAEEIARGLGEGALVSGFAEHSLEVQLPLLARALPAVPVVQVIFGASHGQEFQRLAEVLLRLRDDWRFTVIASSDLSHYHDRASARVLDDHFRELLEAGDPGSLQEALVSGATEACGSGPVLTLMEMARRLGAQFQTVAQNDSSEASGDQGQVVGYLSAVAVLGKGGD